VIRYTVSSILPDGAPYVVATVDAPAVDDEPPPVRVILAVANRWPEADIVSAWIGWRVKIDGRTVGHVDFGSAHGWQPGRLRASCPTPRGCSERPVPGASMFG
jgi:hypothetical protein